MSYSKAHLSLQHIPASSESVDFSNSGQNFLLEKQKKCRPASTTNAEHVKPLAPNSESATQTCVSTSVNAESASELRNIRERCNLGWFCCTSPSWRNWLASSPIEMVTSLSVCGCVVKCVVLCRDRVFFPRLVGVFRRQSWRCFVGHKNVDLCWCRLAS